MDSNHVNKMIAHHLLGIPVSQIPTFSPPKGWGFTDLRGICLLMFTLPYMCMVGSQMFTLPYMCMVGSQMFTLPYMCMVGGQIPHA